MWFISLLCFTFVTKSGTNFLIWTGIVFLNRLSDFCPKNDQRESLLECNWLHSIGQNHFYVMMLFMQGSCFYPESTLRLCSSKRLCEDFKAVKFGSLATVWTT
jgi:hypothetical protein